MSTPKLLNRPGLHLIKATVNTFSVRPIHGRHFGSQKIDIETSIFAAKLDRSFRSPDCSNTSQARVATIQVIDKIEARVHTLNDTSIPEVHGRARRETARRRKSECKVNLLSRNSSRSNDSWRMSPKSTKYSAAAIGAIGRRSGQRSDQ